MVLIYLSVQIKDLIMVMDLTVVFLTSFKQLSLTITLLFLVYKNKTFSVKSLLLFSKFLVEEEVEAGFMVEEVVEIQSQLVNSVTHMVIQLPTVTRDLTVSLWDTLRQTLVTTQIFNIIHSRMFLLNLMGTNKLSLHSLKVHLSILLFLYQLPTILLLGHKLIITIKTSLLKYLTLVIKKGSTSYSQPSTSQIQGNLAYTSVASQHSGGHNSVSPIVVVSEKFAGACQVAHPMTLTDSFFVS
ncbi:uncharacterized protein LOC125419405 [Ziziphus jujuba]|uniref:Uncharacterized protein LOC125419405 n=1 Tax=Ziziphus jujuba TaxID=326968 RepID=A0ABM3I5S8_ZIZJJ|nr:uncharacterized protein LOC125419405 [Ziziphus jujuba]